MEDCTAPKTRLIQFKPSEEITGATFYVQVR